jgi:hypothetical protein
MQWFILRRGRDDEMYFETYRATINMKFHNLLHQQLFYMTDAKDLLILSNFGSFNVKNLRPTEKL